MAEETYSPSESYNNELEASVTDSGINYGSLDFINSLFDPIYPFFTPGTKAYSAFIHGLLRALYFSIVGTFIYFVFTAAKDSFLQQISVNLSSGMIAFNFAVPCARGFKRLKGFFWLVIAIFLSPLFYFAYTEHNIWRDCCLNLATDLLLVVLLDNQFKSILEKIKPLTTGQAIMVVNPDKPNTTNVK